MRAQRVRVDAAGAPRMGAAAQTGEDRAAQERHSGGDRDSGRPRLLLVWVRRISGTEGKSRARDEQAYWFEPGVVARTKSRDTKGLVMGKLIFGMNLSLDGYVDGLSGKLEMPPP